MCCTKKFVNIFSVLYHNTPKPDSPTGPFGLPFPGGSKERCLLPDKGCRHQGSSAFLVIAGKPLFSLSQANFQIVIEIDAGRHARGGSARLHMR